MKTITTTDLDAKLASGDVSRSQILDVRTDLERREMHIEGSSFLPLDALNIKDVLRLTSNQTTYLLCRTDGRAQKAQKRILRDGGCECVIIEGGIAAWKEAGLPLIKGKAVVSLERQVRIAAGILIFLGFSLGMFVHPSWHILSGFVGVGLVIAGLTNTCAMGMAIARMPWNSREAEYCAS